jgi:hypothetical protein
MPAMARVPSAEHAKLPQPFLFARCDQVAPASMDM